MKREQLFDTLTELDDQLLEQYFSMDLELARKHARRRLGVRLTAIAACAAIVLGVCLPAGFLVAHPAGRAIAKGDSAALTEQLNQIEGFRAWQERTAERLEQELPENVWELLQTTPIMDVLTQSQYPDYALKSETFVPYAAGEIEPEILVYYLDDKSEHFSVPKMIDVSPEQYTDEDAPAIYVLDHEGARYELKYAYSLTQSLERQAVHVYELYGDLGVYRAYLDAETGECIYWSYPARITFVPEGEAIGQAADTMTQRAYEMLAASVRDPEAYTLLASTEDGLFVCKYVRTFRGTYESQVVYESKDDQKHPTVHSCDCATFTFDATGSMVSFDLAYLGALRNADKEVRAEFYTLSKDYCRSSYFHADNLSYVRSMQESEYEVVIMPDGGLALNHTFTLELADGNTASIGYIVPMTAAKEELAHLSYSIEELPDTERVVVKLIAYEAKSRQTALTEYTYDESGNLICTVMFVNGVEEVRMTYVYDEQGREIERKTVSAALPAAGGGLKSFYDGQGRLIKQEHYDYRGNSENTTLFAYDEMGRVIMEESDNAITTYTYGENDSCIVLTESKTGNYVQKIEYLYDAAGNKIGVRNYDGDTVTSETTYAYNENGQQTYYAAYLNGERVAYNVTEYKDGKEVRTLCYRDGALEGISTPKHNKFGELVYEEYVDVNGKLIQSTQYDYDYLGQ